MASDNNRFVLRLWIPAILFTTFVAVLAVLALTSGDPGRSLPAAVGLTGAAVIISGTRWLQRRKIARMLHATDPMPFLRKVAAASARIPHGQHLAASNAATILALYGRFDDAESSLASVSWDDVPPIVQAQRSAARATIAYARGAYTDGLDYAVAAAEEGSLDASFPGAETSAIAFRTYRNLGLALTGRAVSGTAGELRTAFAKLPLVGRVLAAWGLAVLAKRDGDANELQAMRTFLERNAPHFIGLEERRRPGG